MTCLIIWRHPNPSITHLRNLRYRCPLQTEASLSASWASSNGEGAWNLTGPTNDMQVAGRRWQHPLEKLGRAESEFPSTTCTHWHALLLHAPSMRKCAAACRLLSVMNTATGRTEMFSSAPHKMWNSLQNLNSWKTGLLTVRALHS
jgi:hypothetical protein